jgi:hypothetical protein
VAHWHVDESLCHPFSDENLAVWSALPQIKSAFASFPNSTNREGLLACSAKPDLPFLPLLKKQKAVYGAKTKADFI